MRSGLAKGLEKGNRLRSLESSAYPYLKFEITTLKMGTVTNGPITIFLIPEIELLGAPKGRRRTAQGVSPGNTYSNNVSPERAKQLVSVL